MTKENVLKYLRDPSYLNQVSYQELKTLVAEYPSSLSLRYLLALKSKQENNSDSQRQLEFLSTYSIDRGHLYDVFHKEKLEEVLPDGVVLQEDYLELKELSILEQEFNKSDTMNVGAAALAFDAISTTTNMDEQNGLLKEEIPTEEFYTLDLEGELSPTPEDKVPSESDEKIQANLAEVEDLFKELEDRETTVPQINVAKNTTSILDLQETLNGGEFPKIPLEVLDTDVDIIEEDEQLSTGNTDSFIPLVEEEGLKVNPVPKTNFSTWFKDSSNGTHFNGFDLIGYNSKGLIEELIQHKKTKSTNSEVEERMEMEEDIASETLAQILVLQGHYHKAIQMLERLKLLYPEKSGFFVAEIQKIQNLEQEKTL